MCPDDEILVVDASDEPVPPGAMGALLTRGPYTPRGYYRAAEHNARAFTPDGWYRTGDVVRLHPSGNLVVEGRDKDLINRGGEKISAEEVENLIYRLPGVARVAAVVKADPDLGERVCAVVVVEPGTHLGKQRHVPPSPSTRPDRRTSSGTCPVLVPGDMRPRVRPAAESFSVRATPSTSSTGRSVRGNRSASSARARG
ncbi:hypothetical protein ACFYWX_20085 [Streptomyces sp. NPDC002888]|uniref:AMP-binding enzyme n=1 Tax=Streptomyces sp. NPDC002888 TaxID=3364668 RepID=UPI0036BC0D7A